MDILKQFAFDFMYILNEMSPYLLLGFLFAGVLKVFIPRQFIDNYLGTRGVKSTVYAALLGVPLPLCSCGVIPTGVSIHKNGASKGATVSFLISTPQTGIDSILATYALMGLPLALIRPFAALFTGIFGGVITNIIDKQATAKSAEPCCCKCNNQPQKPPQSHSKLYLMLKYAFVDFLQDISKWLVIGLLVAAVLSAIIPADFFVAFIGNRYLEMLIVLAVSIPLYVCATGSIPIAGMLMLKGLSPGAALVFLMAGPATNVATITVIRKTLGAKTMCSYLFSVITGAVLFGLLTNYLLPQNWFITNCHTNPHNHNEILPQWLQWTSSITLTILIINGYLKKRKQN